MPWVFSILRKVHWSFCTVAVGQTIDYGLKWKTFPKPYLHSSVPCREMYCFKFLHTLSNTSTTELYERALGKMFLSHTAPKKLSVVKEVGGGRSSVGLAT